MDQDKKGGARRPHLTNEQRIRIKLMLDEGRSLKEIARALGKSHTTISREIRSRSIESREGASGRVTNRCVHRESCELTQICEDRPDCTRRCPACNRCNLVCPRFEEEHRPGLLKAPYVCNGCKKEHRCTLVKRRYSPRKAQADYEATPRDSRSGANITTAQVNDLWRILRPLLNQGQSLHHIHANNPDVFTISVETMYRYAAIGLPGALRGDMPRACMLRPRKAKTAEHKVDRLCREGRAYADLEAFLLACPGVRPVQMDSVAGRVGGKVLLTIMFPALDFMLAFLRERNNARTVAEVFAFLRRLLGADAGNPAPFARLFPCILTDNGSGFSDPAAIEGPGREFTRIFYRDPMMSNQKAQCERNHEFIRMILPKGTSFDSLTQDDVNLMMSHVNSYSRPSLGDCAPIDLFRSCFGPRLLEALGIRRIPSNEIVLKPGLLAKKTS